MNIISEITAALTPTGMEPEVGAFIQEDGVYPDKYTVITPLDERNDHEADNEPFTETNGADVNLYMRGDYQAEKDQMKSLLKSAGFLIVDCGYVMFESSTGHHHYAISVEKTEVL